MNMKEANPGTTKKFAKNSLRNYCQMVHCCCKMWKRIERDFTFVRRTTASVRESVKWFNWKSTVSDVTRLNLFFSLSYFIVCGCYCSLFLLEQNSKRPTQFSCHSIFQTVRILKWNYYIFFSLLLCSRFIFEHLHCKQYSITILFCTVTNGYRKKRRCSNSTMWS